MASATGGRDAIECDTNASAMAINMAETIKPNNYMASSRKHQHDAPSNSERPSKKLESAKFGHMSGRTAEGLRRQATKYPHGLNISIQTVTTNEHQHTTSNGNNNNNSSLHASSDLNANYGYSRASTLRSSWGGNNNDKRQTTSDLNDGIRHTSNGRDAAATSDNCHRKYRISMISSPENLAELQMRRYKYPLTGNYYLDTQDATSMKQPPPLPVLRTYLQRFGRWKYLRWPIIFLASTLLFFGLITYCIWLHDVSVARERYQRRRQEVSKEAQLADNEAQLINFVANTVDVWQRVDESIATTTTTPATSTTNSTIVVTTDHNQQHLQESTILRAISTQARQPPKQQQLTTFKYVVPSKGVVVGDKKQHKADVDKDRDETMSETTTYASAEAALIPTNVLHYSGFNGHQNSFGVPIEEGHRILRLFNNVSTIAFDNFVYYSNQFWTYAL